MKTEFVEIAQLNHSMAIADLKRIEEKHEKEKDRIRTVYFIVGLATGILAALAVMNITVMLIPV